MVKMGFFLRVLPWPPGCRGGVRGSGEGRMWAHVLSTGRRLPHLLSAGVPEGRDVRACGVGWVI